MPPFHQTCDPTRDSILILPPTYGMYSVSAQINDVNVVSIPLEKDYTIDTEKIVDAVAKQPKESPIKVVFVCHPNNPTGNDVSTTKQLERLANNIGDAILVIDEAYVDFSRRDSTAALVGRCPNVIVLQTFSKSWGLAGIRCGVALADPAIVDYLTKMKAPYNVNKMTSLVAISALESVDALSNRIDAIVNERERVFNQLAEMSFVERVWPSQSNFLMFRMKQAKQVHVTMATLKDPVVIRYRGGALNCENCLRVSIGSKEENDNFLESLSSVAKAIVSE